MRCGKPIDKGPNVMAEEYLPINGRRADPAAFDAGFLCDLFLRLGPLALSCCVA